MLTYEQASDKVIIALDCSRERAFELADMLAGKATWVKVGMTLFYSEGPAIVGAMRERGLRVFLDLKVHDIPFQVQGAVRSAAMTGADIISIHGLGSSAMVSAARKGAEEAAEKCGRERCRLVAISVLTSMDQDALADRLANFPAQLSGGEQQRVSIARALAKNPKILLCDEPTGALDYQTGKQILQLLQDTCRRDGITVIIVTHNAALADMADRLIRFKSGRVTQMSVNPSPVPIAQIEW